MDEEEKKHKISGVEFGFMLGVAALFDAVSVVPVLNFASLVVGGGTFALWFYSKGMGLISPKKLAVWVAGGLIEAIPAISVFPSFIVGVIIMFSISRAEDVTGITIPLSKGVRFGGRGEIKGGRSKTRKLARRATQSPKFRSEARARLARLRERQIIRERESGGGRFTPSFNRDLKSPHKDAKRKTA